MFHVKNHKQDYMFAPLESSRSQETSIARKVMGGLFQKEILPDLSVESLRSLSKNTESLFASVKHSDSCHTLAPLAIAVHVLTVRFAVFMKAIGLNIFIAARHWKIIKPEQMPYRPRWGTYFELQRAGFTEKPNLIG